MGGNPSGRKLTVAICVKNGERTIRKAVESICGQAVPPEKIVIVDDGSTDGTVEEISMAQTGGCRIDIIKNNGAGLFDGRNTALGRCDTEFLAFIDADCEADHEWTKGFLRVFADHPEVAGGTGSHPQLGRENWVSRMHRLWFVVDSRAGSGYTDGVVGANSYFRTSVLREVGGWISIELGNAEDMYISEKILSADHKLWHDERLKVYHHYTRDFGDFLKKSFRSGYAITVMMQKAGWRNYWYYYTLGIPLVAAFALAGLVAGVSGLNAGWYLLASVLLGTFAFNLRMFKSIGKTFPRWAVRWIIIWGYSLGVLKALLKDK